MADECSLLKCSNIGCRETLSGENSLDVIKPSVVLLQKKLQLNTSVYKMVHFNVKHVINHLLNNQMHHNILKRTIVTNLKKSKFMYAMFVLRVLHIKVILIDKIVKKQIAQKHHS